MQETVFVPVSLVVVDLWPLDSSFTFYLIHFILVTNANYSLGEVDVENPFFSLLTLVIKELWPLEFAKKKATDVYLKELFFTNIANAG